eukprot:1295079-Prymnesium_polylepis.1
MRAEVERAHWRDSHTKYHHPRGVLCRLLLFSIHIGSWLDPTFTLHRLEAMRGTYHTGSGTL